MRFALLALLLACTAPPPKAPEWHPVISVKQAANSTFRVGILQRFGEDDWEEVSAGTAWIVAADSSGTYLVTAGHVCDESDLEPGVEQSYDLLDRFGLKYGDVTVERRSSTYDLCLLHRDGYLGEPLFLATEMPAYDTPVAAVGAPLGVYGCWGGSSTDQCGMAPITRGSYAGGALVSMPMTGGNSGSPVFSDAGVMGVLVEGYVGFDSLSFVEPIDHLIDFLHSPPDRYNGETTD